jgi:uncharacterized membrane protein
MMMMMMMMMMMVVVVVVVFANTKEKEHRLNIGMQTKDGSRRTDLNVTVSLIRFTETDHQFIVPSI